MSVTYEIRVHHLTRYHEAFVKGASRAAQLVTLFYLGDVAQLHTKWRTRGTDFSEHSSVKEYRDVVGDPTERMYNARIEFTQAEQLYADNLTRIFLEFLSLDQQTQIILTTCSKDNICKIANKGDHCVSPVSEEYCPPQFEQQLLKKLQPHLNELKIDLDNDPSQVQGTVVLSALLNFFQTYSLEAVQDIFYLNSSPRPS